MSLFSSSIVSGKKEMASSTLKAQFRIHTRTHRTQKTLTAMEPNLTSETMEHSQE